MCVEITIITIIVKLSGREKKKDRLCLHSNSMTDKTGHLYDVNDYVTNTYLIQIIN